MHPVTPQTDLTTLLAEAASLTALFNDRFGRLTEKQLNWTPARSEWSVGNCIEHVTVVNQSYFPVMEALVDGTYRPTLWQRLPLLPRLVGPLLIRSLMPGAGMRISAPQPWQPPAAPVDLMALSRFTAVQYELIRLIERCRPLAVESLTIASPAAPFIVYRLLDAWRIIVVHLQHHFIQATQVTEHPHFPTDG
jgi:hypothetical protein